MKRYEPAVWLRMETDPGGDYVRHEDAAELLDALQDMAEQHCFTAPRGAKEEGLTDSGAITANADALELLAEHGRFRIVRQLGRMVCGYFPANDLDAAVDAEAKPPPTSARPVK